MSDTGRHDEADDNRPERTTAAEESRSRDGGDPTPADPAVDETPAGDASEAAEQFAREEGEAPSG